MGKLENSRNFFQWPRISVIQVAILKCPLLPASQPSPFLDKLKIVAGTRHRVQARGWQFITCFILMIKPDYIIRAVYRMIGVFGFPAVTVGVNPHPAAATKDRLHLRGHLNQSRFTKSQ